MPSCYRTCHRHVIARAVPMHSHCIPRCTSGCIQRGHPTHQALHGWPPTRCASPCSQSHYRACPCGCMVRVAAHGVPVLSRGPTRSLRPCTPYSRPTCRRLASNTAGLRPSPRSPARWLPMQQRRRAAVAGSECGRQMRKARLKGAAPRCAPSQSARGLGAARAQGRLRAAYSANALSALGIPCAASAGARWACLESRHEQA